MEDIEEQVKYPYYNLIDPVLEKGLYIFFIVSLVLLIFISSNLG